MVVGREITVSILRPPAAITLKILIIAAISGASELIVTLFSFIDVILIIIL